MCEADVGADHPRQLAWEPEPTQRRSIGVRLPSHAAAAAAAEEPTPKEKPKRRCPTPSGSVKTELGA